MAEYSYKFKLFQSETVKRNAEIAELGSRGLNITLAIQSRNFKFESLNYLAFFPSTEFLAFPLLSKSLICSVFH